MFAVASIEHYKMYGMTGLPKIEFTSEAYEENKKYIESKIESFLKEHAEGGYKPIELIGAKGVVHYEEKDEIDYSYLFTIVIV